MAILHIAGREIRSILTTATGWLVLFGFLVLSGVFWLALITNYVRESQNLVLNPYAASMLKLGDYLIAPWFGNLLVVLLFVGPALSMRLFSEEYRQKTIELLLTSPVRTWEIVFGKYLGAMGFGALLLLPTLYAPATVYFYADPDWGFFVGGYLVLLFTLSLLVSMGMLASSFTESQVVALVLAFSGALGLYVASWLAGEDPEGWLAQASLAGHVQDLLQGALRLSDIVYYVALSLFLLFLTQQRLESFRWS